MKKTLLIVGSVPGDRNVGQIFLKGMFSCIDPKDCVIAALLSPVEASSYQADLNRNLNLPYQVRIFDRPSEHAVRKLSGRIGGLASACHRLAYYDQKIKALTKQIETFASLHNVEQIWATLNMTSVIDIVYQLNQRLNLPLLSHVWDDVHHLCAQRKLDITIRRRTARRFGSILQRSQRTAVICEAMEQEYLHRYRVESKTIRYGVINQLITNSQASISSEFRIGFSGSLYCHTAWIAFQEALGLLNWRIADRPIKLIVMSEKVCLTSKMPASIEYLGWQPTEEAAQEQLAKCDLLYLPQSFSRLDRSLTQLSFPTKLSTYASVGRPIFVHSPDYSSLAKFYRKHALGALCTSTEADDIVIAIRSLTGSSEAYQRATQKVAHVAEKVLSYSTFAAQVTSFFGDTSVDAYPCHLSISNQ